MNKIKKYIQIFLKKSNTTKEMAHILDIFPHRCHIWCHIPCWLAPKPLHTFTSAIHMECK